ncbi:Rap1a/Tai family immunity protein, partial [Burkholderia sp. SIMBA_042]|uniref:Rap1a/Tai family immunity protein n=1 Tax=Burkholderia sp. SIMBA_042 TaxID=3085783 RepID=UPI00397C6CB9
ATATDADNGSTLLRQCQLMLDTKELVHAGRLEVLGAGQCFGKIVGVRNTLVYLADAKSAPKLMCAGGAFITNDQSLRVVVKYLTDHPKDLHMEPSALIMMALMDAFPCD